MQASSLQTTLVSAAAPHNSTYFRATRREPLTSATPSATVELPSATHSTSGLRAIDCAPVCEKDAVVLLFATYDRRRACSGGKPAIMSANRWHNRQCRFPPGLLAAAAAAGAPDPNATAMLLPSCVYPTAGPAICRQDPRDSFIQGEGLGRALLLAPRMRLGKAFGGTVFGGMVFYKSPARQVIYAQQSRIHGRSKGRRLISTES